ncbi:MAG: putative lipid II flippase FtsW [Corynebacterium sp.]|uniref:putative lipid II flippase FtsW n=1 Tax=Corynebacterium sp. TaxID=1720 RepID=UPI0026DC8823|nr:putative lipid II flippase FtsW [Corynebacterium sp.]MDO4761437.1 putative lipid II flippase FtsW [Corynebacterium sp.]
MTARTPASGQPQSRSLPESQPRTKNTQGSGGGGFWDALSARRKDIFARPYFDYFNILIVVFMLAAFGVVMVTSASMSWSVTENGSVWAFPVRQAVLVCLGLVAMWMAMRMRPQTVRKLSWALLIVSIVLLIAVLIPGVGTGMEEKGSQSWIVVGPLRLQPSEIARVAIAVWGSSHLAGHKPEFKSWKSPFSSFCLVALTMTLLILAEADVGMALTFLMVVIFLLFFAGINVRIIGLIAGCITVGLASLIFSGSFRSHRFSVYFDALFGHFEDTKDTAFQSYQGFLSLADGHLTGVGIGQSRAKWFYLPEAKNDFIFAVIGEELGLVGGAIVIALFAWLGYVGFRVAMRSENQFLGLLAATLTSGIVVQAFVNMGYVIGLLPVTGIQLPLISYGGTSAVITLAAMGLLANCARHEPEAISAMQAYGRPAFETLLLLPEPTLEGLESPAKVGLRPRQRSNEDAQARPSTARDVPPASPRGADAYPEREVRRSMPDRPRAGYAPRASQPRAHGGYRGGQGSSRGGYDSGGVDPRDSRSARGLGRSTRGNQAPRGSERGRPPLRKKGPRRRPHRPF